MIDLPSSDRQPYIFDLFANNLRRGELKSIPNLSSILYVENIDHDVNSIKLHTFCAPQKTILICKAFPLLSLSMILIMAYEKWKLYQKKRLYFPLKKGRIINIGSLSIAPFCCVTLISHHLCWLGLNTQIVFESKRNVLTHGGAFIFKILKNSSKLPLRTSRCKYRIMSAYVRFSKNSFPRMLFQIF